MTSRKLTIIESPFAATHGRTMDENLLYLRDCLRDSWRRGELPFASHAFFPLFLNESDPIQRQEGIEAGYEFWSFYRVHLDYKGSNTAPRIAFYCDHGISPGMAKAIDRAKQLNREVEMRYLLEYKEPVFSNTEGGLS